MGKKTRAEEEEKSRAEAEEKARAEEDRIRKAREAWDERETRMIVEKELREAEAKRELRAEAKKIVIPKDISISLSKTREFMMENEDLFTDYDRVIAYSGSQYKYSKVDRQLN